MTFKLFLIGILIINGAGVLYVIFFILQKKRDAIRIESMIKTHMDAISDEMLAFAKGFSGIKDKEHKEHEPGVIYDGME